VQGYNARLVVIRDQIIAAAEVVQDRNDGHRLLPMLREGIKKRPKVAAADPVTSARKT